MGEVYRAHDTMLRRAVALKIVRNDPGVGGTVGVADPAQRARFLREARAVAGLRHPNVVTIFDVGEIDATPYLAMELLDGSTLRRFIGQPVAMDRRVRWLAEIASALGAAHRAGLVHRDVKPENVMVCIDDTVKILDFGVAKVDVPDGPLSAAAHAQGAASFRTGFGAVVGTPRYMAPEQAAGLASDPRTDEFAWGLVAFELLTGLHPRDVRPGFSKEAEWREPAEPVERLCPGLPQPIAQAITRALERFADARFPSMEPIALALAPFAAPPVPRGFESTAPAAPAAPQHLVPSGMPTVPHPSTLGSQTIASPMGLAPGPPPAPPRKSGPGLALGLGALGLLVLGGGGASLAYWKLYAATDAAPTSAADAGAASNASAAGDAGAPSSSKATPTAAPTVTNGPRHADAGLAHDAGAKPRAIALGTKVMILRAGDYPPSVVENALAGRIASVERCMNASGVTASPTESSTINFSYESSGQVLSSSIDTSPSMTKCMSMDIAQGIALPAPKSGQRGGALVTVYLR